MRAVSIRSGQVRFRDDAPMPKPAAGEVLVRVTRAGICETDLQLAKGYMNFDGILGHEFVGIAESGQFNGQRVVGEINCNCRQCPRCDASLGNHCANRTVIGIDRHDGAFAQYVAVPQHNLHVVPDAVSDDEAVFVEPLAAAFQITQQVAVQSGHQVLILGDGRLGLMSAKAIVLSGADITVIGKHKHKLQRFALLGAATRLLGQPIQKESFHVVVDCTGSPTGLAMAMQLVRPRGTIVMKTTVAANHDISLAPIVINEINVVGSRCGPFDKALNALANCNVLVDNLITHRFGLQSAAEAMRCAASPESFKVIFDIS